MKIKIKSKDKPEIKEEKKERLETFQGDLETLMKIVREHLEKSEK